MKVGFIGVGKLGGPMAALFATIHDVMVFDRDPDAVKRLQLSEEPTENGRWWSHELDMLHTLTEGKVREAESIAEMAAWAEVVFLVVDTPHAPHLDGSFPTNGLQDRQDFDYTNLVAAFRQVSAASRGRPKPLLAAVVSTVLPGTSDRLLRPLLHPGLRMVYTPAFVAMGRVIPDYRRPEFVLIGADDYVDVGPVVEAISAIIGKEHTLARTSVASAELAKVAYNTFISAKLAFAGMLAAVCDATAADVDEVTGVLQLGFDRITSGAYMTAGMGDGGPCHPRDNLAFSWLLQKLGNTVDLPGMLMQAREIHALWLVSLVHAQHERTGLPVFILGTAFKADSPITVGSPALLLGRLLDRSGVLVNYFDPVTTPEDEIVGAPLLEGPGLFVLATDHSIFKGFPYPAGSIVVDPWGSAEDLPDVAVIRPGRKR